jgi:hypothetical protein
MTEGAQPVSYEMLETPDRKTRRSAASVFLLLGTIVLGFCLVGQRWWIQERPGGGYYYDRTIYIGLWKIKVCQETKPPECESLGTGHASYVLAGGEAEGDKTKSWLEARFHVLPVLIVLALLATTLMVVGFAEKPQPIMRGIVWILLPALVVGSVLLVRFIGWTPPVESLTRGLNTYLAIGALVAIGAGALLIATVLPPPGPRAPRPPPITY